MEVTAEERTVTREVEVKLTVTELADYGVRSGQLAAEEAKLNEEFSAVKKEWSTKIGAVSAELAHLHKKLEEKKEVRLVECREVKDFGLNTVKIYHGEELIEERPLTAQERQVDMFEPKEADEVLEAENQTPEEAQQDLADAIRSETNPHTKVSMLEGPQ